MLALPAQAALGFLPVALPIAFWVAWSDMRGLRIPNAACAAMVALYLFAGPVLLAFDAWAWGWVQLLIVLAGGLVFFIVGAFGAGDAKYAAAIAPFVAPADAVFFIVLLAAVLLAALVTHRGVRAIAPLRRLAPGWASWSGREFPMGLALAPALIFYLLLCAVQG